MMALSLDRQVLIDIITFGQGKVVVVAMLLDFTLLTRTFPSACRRHKVSEPMAMPSM